MVVARELGCLDIVQKEYTRRCTWFAAPAGTEEYKRLGFPKLTRSYQKEAIVFLGIRSWAIEGDPPRAGKTLTLIATLILLGVPKAVIVCPAVAKYEWAQQFWRWAGYEVAVLFGQSGREVRVYCGACQGSRRVEVAGKRVPCPTCKAKNGQSMGERIYLARDLEPVTAARRWQEPAATGKLKKDGTPRMVWRAERYIVEPVRYQCLQHPEVPPTSKPGVCPACAAEVAEVLEKTRFIVVNYDILTARRTKNARGVESYSEKLPGWAKVLSRYHFGAAAADEAHTMRGWTSNKEDRENSRRQRFNEMTEKIDRVWMVTATPSYGFTRDYWSILDSASGGLFS